MWREILGLEKKTNNLVELFTPRRGFADVILPDDTRRQLYAALTQIEKHQLIFTQWGLGERHPTGMGLAFNFAGPPGTGKTICAEAIAYTLSRKLLRVSYAELESCWMGETGKNVRSVFREARTQGAVLFFDEADSIAGRRFSDFRAGNERETNQTVNILLKELEEHDGVVIFATNMASNFDPAFERRIRTHILFRMPGVREREQIWKVQLHPTKTPLGPDVDFHVLSERYEVTGGDIRNAVLKAAQIAAAEEGADAAKEIHQHHFIAAMEEVVAARQVMQQNAIDPNYAPLQPWQEPLEAAGQRLQSLDEDLHACRTELEMLGAAQGELDTDLRGTVALLTSRVTEMGGDLRDVQTRSEALENALASLRAGLDDANDKQATAIQAWTGEQRGLVDELIRRIDSQEGRLKTATLIGLPKAWTVTAASLLSIALLALGALGGRFLFH